MMNRDSTRRSDRNHVGVVALVFVAAVAVLLSILSADRRLASPAVASGDALIVYESGGPFGHVGETTAILTQNLVGHFGQVTAIPTAKYQPRLLDNFRSLIYVGSLQRDRPIQASFVDDVLRTSKNVLWLGHNLDDLQYGQDRNETFKKRFGFTTGAPVDRGFRSVTYKATTLTRAENAGHTVPILLPESTSTNPKAPLEILAVASTSAAKEDGTGTVSATTADRSSGQTGASQPWAVRSGNLTFVSEVPFSYATERDRYLAFADLLFDHLAPGTPERHRALLRLEDVSPKSKPETLRKIADALFAENVPFSVQIISEYVNPDLDGNGANASVIRLSERPEVVDAINYMLQRGGTLVMHGTTHQSGTRRNPYAGVSGEDFEFVSTSIDQNGVVQVDGPLPEDSPSWAAQVIDSGLAELEAAGVPRPAYWTTPHYAATPDVYRTLTTRFKARYERGLYTLQDSRAGAPRKALHFGQFFPYVVRDTFGSIVLPENLGNQVLPSDSGPGRSPQEILQNAKANLVVRDGFASFFWHPYLAETPAGVTDLTDIVRGIRALGYTFVSLNTAVSELTSQPAGPAFPSGKPAR